MAKKNRRRAQQVAITISDVQNQEQGKFRELCTIKGSVRNMAITLRIEGGAWPGMTLRQARRLRDYLDRAIAELEQRLDPENR